MQAWGDGGVVPAAVVCIRSLSQQRMARLVSKQHRPMDPDSLRQRPVVLNISLFCLNRPLHHITLHHTALHCIALHCITTQHDNLRPPITPQSQGVKWTSGARFTNEEALRQVGTQSWAATCVVTSPPMLQHVSQARASCGVALHALIWQKCGLPFAWSLRKVRSAQIQLG
jgi:hypothetical protein